MISCTCCRVKSSIKKVANNQITSSVIRANALKYCFPPKMQTDVTQRESSLRMMGHTRNVGGEGEAKMSSLFQRVQSYFYCLSNNFTY